MTTLAFGLASQAQAKKVYLHRLEIYNSNTPSFRRYVLYLLHSAIEDLFTFSLTLDVGREWLLYIRMPWFRKCYNKVKSFHWISVFIQISECLINGRATKQEIVR